MAVNLSPVYGVAGQLFDNNGNPLAGGKIYTYLAGTTTNAATYTNSAGNIAHSNPIVLDGAGRVPSGEIWLTDGITYKFVVEDSASNLIGTYDNIVGINSNFVNFTNSQELQTATAGQTIFNLTTMQYQPGTNSLSVFVDGVNQYGPGAQYAYVETDSDTVTFVSGLHVGASVKFTTSQLNTSGAVDAEQVSYNPPFAGGVSTNVEEKLSEYVSVTDFGAATTNTATQNETAFEAALASGKKVFIPAGIWPIQNVDVPSGACIQGSGIGKTVLLVTSGEDGLILGGSPPISYIANAQISDLEIRNDEAYIANDPPAPGATHTGFGLVLVGVVDSSFDNILIQYFEYGVYARSSWDLKFGLFKAYNCNIGFKVPRLGVGGNTTFNSTSFQTFVSEGCLIAGASFGYGANLSFQAAQIENQQVGMYFAESYFIDVGTAYWEWSNTPGLGDYVFLFGQDESGDFGTPAHLNIRNIMTSTYSAGVGVKNADNVYLSGELQWSSLALSGNTNFRWDGFSPKAAFSAYLSASVNNVTGDNTAYTVICDTELFDDGNYYNNSTGVFTAPEDGKYRFTAKAFLAGLLAAHDYQTISIIAGGQTYSKTMQFFSAANVMADNAIELNIVAPMAAGDTAFFQVQVTGTPLPTKVVDVAGGSAKQTLFCGEFVATV